MKGNGVVDLTGDPAAAEMLPKLFAPGSADDVLVKDVGGAGVGEGEE